MKVQLINNIHAVLLPLGSYSISQSEVIICFRHDGSSEWHYLDVGQDSKMIGLASGNKDSNTMTGLLWSDIVEVADSSFYKDYLNPLNYFHGATESGHSLLTSKDCFLTCPIAEPKYEDVMADRDIRNKDVTFERRVTKYNHALSKTGDWLIIKTK